MTAAILRIPNHEHQSRVLETRRVLGFRTVEEWREMCRAQADRKAS